MKKNLVISLLALVVVVCIGAVIVKNVKNGDTGENEGNNTETKESSVDDKKETETKESKKMELLFEKINTEDSEKNITSAEMEIIGDVIYYVDVNGVCKVSLYDRTKKNTIEVALEVSESANLYNDSVDCYCFDKDSLYKINSDGNYEKIDHAFAENAVLDVYKGFVCFRDGDLVKVIDLSGKTGEKSFELAESVHRIKLTEKYIFAVADSNIIKIKLEDASVETICEYYFVPKLHYDNNVLYIKDGDNVYKYDINNSKLEKDILSGEKLVCMSYNAEKLVYVKHNENNPVTLVVNDKEYVICFEEKSVKNLSISSIVVGDNYIAIHNVGTNDEAGIYCAVIE